MIKLSKLTLMAAVLLGTGLSALADRGISKKSKSKVTLNISTPTTLRNSVSLNLKTGLKYTGSFFVNQQYSGGSFINNSLVTYQKGNTVYIIPYKQKVVMPDIKPDGSTGMKINLKSH
ncbi:MAG: hypothetical protein JST86_06240 [Bacteroidetes bacterium]|nr:hypothetical protein [Bacteroidota bacterium]